MTNFALPKRCRLVTLPALAAMALPAIVLSLNPIRSNSQTGILPPAAPAAHVRITKGPSLESVKDSIAIIRWTANNPGGTDEHFGVVHYGTVPGHLDKTAKSHIRLNQGHPETIFRVRLDGLDPRTTYYYTVDSIQSNGRSDGVKSPVNHFATP